MTVALGLVLVFHFTSEIAALVTVLGFAAAGIAFALQNVILAVAGYFTMVAPNGIRVGDQVSLQGPFGYVHGEVSEIGLTRVKLRELGGDPLQPTGRVVVFPNSVSLQENFFKDPPGGFKDLPRSAREPRRRRAPSRGRIDPNRQLSPYRASGRQSMGGRRRPNLVGAPDVTVRPPMPPAGEGVRGALRTRADAGSVPRTASSPAQHAHREHGGLAHQSLAGGPLDLHGVGGGVAQLHHVADCGPFGVAMVQLDDLDSAAARFHDVPPGREALQVEGQSPAVGEEGLELHLLDADRLVAPGARAPAATAGNRLCNAVAGEGAGSNPLGDLRSAGVWLVHYRLISAPVRRWTGARQAPPLGKTGQVRVGGLSVQRARSRGQSGVHSFVASDRSKRIVACV